MDAIIENEIEAMLRYIIDDTEDCKDRIEAYIDVGVDVVVDATGEFGTPMASVTNGKIVTPAGMMDVDENNLSTLVDSFADVIDYDDDDWTSQGLKLLNEFLMVFGIFDMYYDGDDAEEIEERSAHFSLAVSERITERRHLVEAKDNS